MTTAAEEVSEEAATGEELEPLFNYKRVQPAMTFRFDDSDLEKAAIFKHCNKRPKGDTTEADEAGEKAKVVEVEEEEEDWLAPPSLKPTFRSEAEEDSTLRELRLKKQELAKFAESAQEILQRLEETAKKEVGAKESPEQIILEEASEPEVEKAREKTQVEKEREKIVISIQDKDGQQQICIYKDDKFDRLFKAYAKKAKLNPSNLTFVFDGDKINPASTPEDLELEDNDMIEVRRKGR